MTIGWVALAVLCFIATGNLVIYAIDRMQPTWINENLVVVAALVGIGSTIYFALKALGIA